MHIFLNYRRADSADQAYHVYEWLERKFGSENVFLDIEALPAGVDYVEGLEHEMGRCGVLLVMIGPGWISATGPTGQRRIDEPDDFVRLEIEAALKRDIRVIPVLVGGAVMPEGYELPESIASLARRQGAEVKSAPSEFNFTMERLIDRLETILQPAGSADRAQTEPRRVPAKPWQLHLPRRNGRRAIRKETTTAVRPRRRLAMAVVGGILVLAIVAAVLVVSGVLSTGATFPAVIRVGREPAGIAIGNGSVWVANSADNTVTRIDEATGKVLGTPIRVGDDPRSVAVGEGYVWVAAFDGSITKIDPRSGQVVGSFTSSGSHTNVEAGAGYLWVGNFNGKFQQINPATGAVLMATSNDGDFTGSATVDGSVWFVSNRSSGQGTLSHWQTNPGSSFSRGTSTGGEGPWGVTAASGYIWVPNFISANVAKIDPATDAVVGKIEDAGSAQNPEDIAGGFGAVWLVDQDAGSLTRIDPSSNAKDTRSIHATPSALAIGESRIWVLQKSAGTVTPVKPWGPGGGGGNG